MLLLGADRSGTASCPFLEDAGCSRSALEAREPLKAEDAECSRTLERGAGGYLDDAAAAYKTSVADMCEEL